MFSSPIVEQLLKTVPNGKMFERPMSKNARTLLTTMIEWSQTKPGYLSKFALIYDAIAYEEAVQKYDTYKFQTLLKGHKPKTDEEILSTLTLSMLKNYEWSHKLPPNPHKIGLISRPRSVQVYRWLTSYFIMTDFNEDALNKISDLGDEKFSLELIKAEANKISNINQKNVPYLYAIVMDITEKNKIVNSQAAQTEKRYADKLSRIISDSAEPKQAHKFDGDELERWQRERQYLDLLDSKHD